MSNFGWAARTVLATAAVGLLCGLPAQAEAAASRAAECSPVSDHNDDGCFFADPPAHGHQYRHDPPSRNDRDGGGGRGGTAPTSVGPRWGVIDRNTTGGASATLRSGPYETAFGNHLQPPSGIGSLNIQTPAGTKVDFGNEVDFVGQKVASLTNVSFYVYTTAENQAAANGGVNNLPVIRLEIDPNDGVSGTYSTLVFVPAGAASNNGKFTKFDAATTGYWYLTGAAGTTTGCTRSTATPCSLDTVKLKLPASTISTVLVGKGQRQLLRRRGRRPADQPHRVRLRAVRGGATPRVVPRVGQSVGRRPRQPCSSAVMNRAVGSRNGAETARTTSGDMPGLCAPTTSIESAHHSPQADPPAMTSLVVVCEICSRPARSNITDSLRPTHGSRPMSANHPPSR
jgi:hypothetical protein